MNYADFAKYEPNAGRGQLIVTFREPPAQYVRLALKNQLDGQGCEESERQLKFWCSNRHVSDYKVRIAKQVLHRLGYQRFDDVFYDDGTAKELFGCDLINMYDQACSVTIKKDIKMSEFAKFKAKSSQILGRKRKRYIHCTIADKGKQKCSKLAM